MRRYIGVGSSSTEVGEGHPPIGLYVVEQSHALHPMPVSGIGQICHGDVGMGKTAVVDVIEKFYRRPWTALQVDMNDRALGVN